MRPRLISEHCEHEDWRYVERTVQRYESVCVCAPYWANGRAHLVVDKDLVPAGEWDSFESTVRRRIEEATAAHAYRGNT